MTPLRVASYPYLVYLPQIVAAHFEMYGEEGIMVEHRYHRPSPGTLPIDLRGNQVDLIVGNVWMSLRSWAGDDQLVPISHMSQQTKWIIAGQQPQPDFTWQSLKGRRVIFPCESPTIWTAFRQVLRDASVTLDEIRLIIGFSTQARAEEEFQAGAADYLVADLEVAQIRQLTEVGTIADSLGPIPWSVFCAPRKVVETRHNELLAFRRAIGRALKWIAEASPTEIGNALRKTFDSIATIDGIDHSARIKIIERYKSLGTGEWPNTPALDVNNVAYWQDILVRWGSQLGPAPLQDVLAFNDSAAARL